MGRIGHAGRELAAIDRVAHRSESSRAVAHVQVDDAGLPGHEAAHVRIRCDSEQLVRRRRLDR